MRVKAAILTPGNVRVGLYEYLVGLPLHPGVERLRITRVSAKPVTNARNIVMRQFRETGEDWLLMLDNDVVPRGDVLEYVGSGFDIVVFPCPVWKATDTSPLLTRFNFLPLGTNDEPAYDACLPPVGGVTPIHSGGTGAVLISRAVAIHPEMKVGFHEVIDDDGVSVRGHDLEFMGRARGLGFSVGAALKCPCSHYQTVDLLSVHARMMLILSSPGESMMAGRQ